MDTQRSLADLADEKFVSLTTFRRSGERVSTPVWVGRDGDALIVTTREASGKVKRLRNSARVEVSPCDRRGRVEHGMEPVGGVAQIVTDDGPKDRLTDIIRAKYGFEFRLVMAIERLARSRQARRVILRITPG